MKYKRTPVWWALSLSLPLLLLMALSFAFSPFQSPDFLFFAGAVLLPLLILCGVYLYLMVFEIRFLDTHMELAGIRTTRIYYKEIEKIMLYTLRHTSLQISTKERSSLILLIHYFHNSDALLKELEKKTGMKIVKA